MMFTETREGRRFVGEIPPGQLLLGGLRALCGNYRIASGWLDGAGLLRDASLRCHDAQGALGEVELLPGVCTAIALQIAISEANGALDLVARGLLVTAGGRTVAGLLEEATSASLEFTLQSFDDVTLRRFAVPGAAPGRWLGVAVQPNGPTDGETVRSGRVALEAMPSRLLDAEEMPLLRAGDALAHPRLGLCVVTQVNDQDRVTIQMESGQVAQLHLGMLRLAPAPARGGRTVYDVTVRRRGT